MVSGFEIAAILEKSTVWAEFKDQKHDLFLTNAPGLGYLTGGLILMFMYFIILKLINFYYFCSRRWCRRVFDVWNLE